MNAERPNVLTESQFALLSTALHQAAQRASVSLQKWLDRPASISIDAVEQVPLPDAARILGDEDTPIGCCTTEINGALAGEFILAFDDASGWALADMLLDQPPGTTSEWDELTRSAAEETTNIVCCAYVNALSETLTRAVGIPCELMPGPPVFRIDFAESVLQSALVGQAMAGDDLLVARAAFCIATGSVNWSLVFVPNAASMENLQRALGG
jgi:chemotaxis protein CheC